jgi:hypothetical protein
METTFKKILILLFISLSTFFAGYAQFSFGLGSTMGLGYMRSSQLKQGAEVIKEQNSDIINLSYKVRASAQIGFQGVIQYRLTHQLCVVATPGFNLYRSTYNNIYIEKEQINPDDYIKHTVNSIAKFKSTQLMLPIIAKYYIIPDKNYFATAGFMFAYNTGMRMYSEEDSITSFYNTTGLASSSAANYEYNKIKVDGFKPFQMHMLFGIGTSILTGYRHNLDIELNYAIPLTSTPYYTTDATFSANALTNSVYTQDGKAAFESASGKNLNHYRMHQITLTVRYLIYSINK